MQKAAPTYTPPASGPCPSIEEMAAYIDGNLDQAEGKRMTDHIASCEDCYFIYSETARFQIDSSPASPEETAFDEKVVPFPSRRGLIAKWGAIAALLLTGVGSGAYFQFLMPPPALPTGDMTASLPESPEVQKGFWLGPTTRGGGDEENEVKLDDASFRTGVQLVNLQMSLRAGKVTKSQDVIARILGLLKSQLFTDDLQKGYTAITIALANGKTPAEVLPEATRLARESREAVETTSLDLGQWVETARLSSLASSPSFFQQSESRQFLRRLLWRDRTGFEKDFKLDAPTRASLERISDVLGKGDLKAADYAEIRRETEKILEIHYPEA